MYISAVSGPASHAGHQHEVQLRPADRGPLQDGQILPGGLVSLRAWEGEAGHDDDDDDDDMTSGDGVDAKHEVPAAERQLEQDCDGAGQLE